jgi:RNA polymerase sigma-70 factor, ECF subfamily
MNPPSVRRPKVEEERRALAHAYRRHSEELYRFCLRRVGNPTLAEEALATVFLEAWRRHREVDFDSLPIRPWLFGVARNVLRNQCRAQRRQEATVRSLESLHRRYADDASEEVARRQLTGALVGSLEALPDGQRQVVALCLLGGSSYESAAGDLDVPIGTVRSRLARARLTLALAVRTVSGC